MKVCKTCGSKNIKWGFCQDCKSVNITDITVKKISHSKQWFIDKIGQIIAFGETFKKCQKEYVDIWDGKQDGKQVEHREMHADYLYDCQGCLDIEYFDKPIRQNNFNQKALKELINKIKES